jgi:hypothetical protein
MMTAQSEWNPRYFAYATDHGNTPEKQREVDRERWPGGSMCGFMFWIQDRWKEWTELTKHPRSNDPYAFISEADHVSFDAWLSERKQQGNLQ